MKYDHYDRFGYTSHDREDAWVIGIIGIFFGALMGAIVGLAM